MPWPMIPESHADLLEKKGFAHVATIGADGAPQSTPVWYGWDGRHVCFSHVRGRQKLRNIERDPRVALSILDPDDPYRYLEVRGRVVAVDDDADLAFINSMAKKYLGVDENPWAEPGQERVVVRVAPDHCSTL